ncbi:response regulator [Singulisphaera sp. PoT]|uniref:response regulator n=1 Tax=Singulisphaera sp. PoT TaxID=3411797 RepID=UPI003BF5A371
MNDATLRILVVDDCADSARMLRMLMKREGYQVSIEFDGPTALAKALESAPDVVLLDLSLPVMSGLEVASEMRKRPELAGCTIVAVSGHGEEMLPSPSPFDRHFQKPLELDALKVYLEGIRVDRKPPFPTPTVA